MAKERHKQLLKEVRNKKEDGVSVAVANWDNEEYPVTIMKMLKPVPNVRKGKIARMAEELDTLKWDTFAVSRRLDCEQDNVAVCKKALESCDNLLKIAKRAAGMLSGFSKGCFCCPLPTEDCVAAGELAGEINEEVRARETLLKELKQSEELVRRGSASERRLISKRKTLRKKLEKLIRDSGTPPREENQTETQIDTDGSNCQQVKTPNIKK